MLYLLWGFIIGIVLNILPLWEPSAASEIYPEWQGKIDAVKDIAASPNKALFKIILHPVITESSVSILSGSGSEIENIMNNGSLISASGSGGYIAKYQKVGNEVEFLNARGERFWKVRSNEYPYLSHNGRLVLLLNGDQSRLRILDFNGNNIGVKQISGRLCTVISFSEKTDFAGAGFLDGWYYIINNKGQLAASDRVPDESLIKGIAISDSGNFFAIHYGNNRSDNIRLGDLEAGKIFNFPIKNIHHTRTAIAVSDSGRVYIIDYNRIIITDDEGNTEIAINIPPGQDGVSSINCRGGVNVAVYTGTDGLSRLIIFNNDGDVILHREFPDESFLESFIQGRALFLRGSQGLYCYSYYLQDQ